MEDAYVCECGNLPCGPRPENDEDDCGCWYSFDSFGVCWFCMDRNFVSGEW